MMKARAAYAAQAELLRNGVELSGSSISYTFTGLNELKPHMIAEATRNARRSAEQFARDSGASVGQIKTASQGYFSVGARDGEDCEDCGSSGGTFSGSHSTSRSIAAIRPASTSPSYCFDQRAIWRAK